MTIIQTLPLAVSCLFAFSACQHPQNAIGNDAELLMLAKNLDSAYPGCLETKPSRLAKLVLKNEVPEAAMPLGYHNGFASFVIYGYQDSKLIKDTFDINELFSHNPAHMIVFEIPDMCGRYMVATEDFAILYNERAAQNRNMSK